MLGLLGIEDKAHEDTAVGILVVPGRRLRTLPGKILHATASLTRCGRFAKTMRVSCRQLRGLAIDRL
jgi:hypothetical protein